MFPTTRAETHLSLFSGFGGHVQRSSASEVLGRGEGGGRADGGEEGNSGEFHLDVQLLLSLWCCESLGRRDKPKF